MPVTVCQCFTLQPENNRVNGQRLVDIGQRNNPHPMRCYNCQILHTMHYTPIFSVHCVKALYFITVPVLINQNGNHIEQGFHLLNLL